MGKTKKDKLRGVHNGDDGDEYEPPSVDELSLDDEGDTASVDKQEKGMSRLSVDAVLSRQPRRSVS